MIHYLVGLMGRNLPGGNSGEASRTVEIRACAALFRELLKLGRGPVDTAVSKVLVQVLGSLFTDTDASWLKNEQVCVCVIVKGSRMGFLL